MERKKIGVYDYTVVLTYVGFLVSVFGIMQVLQDQYWNAIVCLMVAGVCDMFDGAVAATKKNRLPREKRFGIQIDSLSDLVSFGVFPALFVYEMSGKSMVVGVISCAYALCALIRLAYYNVLEEERQDRIASAVKEAQDLESQVMTEEKKVYLGLPVTVIAIALPALFFFYDESIMHKNIWLGGLLALMAVLFVTPFEIEKPKFMGKLVLIVLGMLEVIAMAWLALVGAT